VRVPAHRDHGSHGIVITDSGIVITQNGALEEQDPSPRRAASRRK
jgi:hypothetical protein